jgi:hypothetical protein
MKHLSEEEWIEYYYGEGPSSARQAMQEHIVQCSECAVAGRELAEDLALMRPREGEALRDSNYGEEVWQTLRTSLTPYPRIEMTRRLGWPEWLTARVMVVSAAVLLAAIAGAAFYSGRLWEKKQAPQVAATNNGQTGQRIILYVVSDHLDRSQRLLAELNDPEQAAADHSLQATARELLTENRLYRQSSTRLEAAGTEDASLETILDNLEPALIELANQPDNLNSAKIERLRKELNTGELLFEIRVLRSKARQQEPNSGALHEGTV